MPRPISKRRKRELHLCQLHYPHHIKSSVIPYISSAGDKLLSAEGDLLEIKQVLPAVIAGDRPKLMVETVEQWQEETGESRLSEG